VGFCIRRRDEYGNRHDEVAASLHMLPVVAGIVERGYSDEYRDIIVLEGGRARIISIVRAGAETYCHEYSGVGVDEACEIIRKYLGRRDVEVLMEPAFNDVCNLLDL
jgi:hypothetical protein